MHPVAHTAAGSAHIRIAAENIFGSFAEIQFVEMLAAYPFPYDFSRPVDLDDGIVQQALVRHFGIGQIFVTQQ